MIFILSSLIATLATGLIYSVRINLSYSDRFDEIQSIVQDSIDILNEQYINIDKKTKLEVFFDEPVVKDLVQDIAVAREAVLKIARTLDDSLDVDSPASKNEET